MTVNIDSFPSFFRCIFEDNWAFAKVTLKKRTLLNVITSSYSGWKCVSRGQLSPGADRMPLSEQ